MVLHFQWGSQEQCKPSPAWSNQKLVVAGLNNNDGDLAPNPRTNNILLKYFFWDDAITGIYIYKNFLVVRCNCFNIGRISESF